MSDETEDFVERLTSQVEALIRRRTVIESKVIAWSGTNGRAGLDIHTPLHVFSVPLSIGACGRLHEFLSEHVAWTASHTPGVTEAMVRDLPPDSEERNPRRVDYDDHTPVDETIRHQFLVYFFFVGSRDGHPLLSPGYVEEKIDRAFRAKGMWQLEQMLHPSAIREWRERRGQEP